MNIFAFTEICGISILSGHIHPDVISVQETTEDNNNVWGSDLHPGHRFSGFIGKIFRSAIQFRSDSVLYRFDTGFSNL
jgi:hypothetical protein